MSAQDAPYNFATASELDPWVHGAERPCYDRPVPYAWGEVTRWEGFMQDQGIRRVLCLLDGAQLGRYPRPLLGAYEAAGLQVVHVPLEDFTLPEPSTLRGMLRALEDAEKAREAVVVHCSAGIGRTGGTLAAWLAWRHGLALDDSIARVRGHARLHGAYRDPLESGRGARAALERALGALPPRLQGTGG